MALKALLTLLEYEKDLADGIVSMLPIINNLYSNVVALDSKIVIFLFYCYIINSKLTLIL